jgi:hypothetical protein
VLTEIPNGLDEIIATYGSLDDPQFENKHIVSFDLPYTLRFEGQPVKHSRCHKVAVDNFVQALKNVQDAGLADQFVEYNGYLRAPGNSRARIAPITSLVGSGNRHGRFNAPARQNGSVAPGNPRLVCQRRLFLGRQFQVAQGLHAFSVSDGVLRHHLDPYQPGYRHSSGL